MTMDKSLIPAPVFDARPEWVDFYWLAWRQAYDHIRWRAEFPQSPYMDEGCADAPNTIWIWDTCYMALFCRYSWRQFPGIESLNNFYAILHDRHPFDLTIQHPDNPPLFAWAEYQYVMVTGDLDRIRWLLTERQYLQKHYHFIEQMDPDKPLHFKHAQLTLRADGPGYHWGGVQSGMDNTPRGRGDYAGILWLDILAQQALAALYIARLADLIADHSLAAEYRRRHQEKVALLNRYYWDETDGFYYDIAARPPHEPVKVKTVASFWPWLCEACDAEKLQRMTDILLDPRVFGTMPPWPTLARDDPDYEPSGGYWRGSVWLPTAYMATKGLEKYGRHDLAEQLSGNLLDFMYRTYAQHEPHTIWEAYNPEKPLPADNKRGRFVRQDFCGWSALGPISLFIENVLGFHAINALDGEVHWRKRPTGRHGLKNLRFGAVCADIIAADDTVHVKTNQPFTLIIDGCRHPVASGTSAIAVNNPA